ncbi:MAG: hypothetical protein WCG75_01005 [Armatimonadota bacterium]
MKSNRSRNPWSQRRPQTLPILSLGIGTKQVQAIDISPERHLAERVRAYLAKAHWH